MKFIDKLKARLELKKASSRNDCTGVILVVQQDMNKLNHLKGLIETCCPHCLVLGYTNGDEALDQIKDNGDFVDICFTDVNHTGAGGFELNSALMERKQKSVVLVAQSSEHALAARQAGIKGYILYQHVTLEQIAYVIYNFNENIMFGCDKKVREAAKNIYLRNYL